MLCKRTKTKACSYVEAQKSWVTKIMCFQWKWMFWFFCRTAQSSWTPKVDSHCYSMEKYFFFSFDRIFLIIHQFERYPYMLSQLSQRLHVLKLRKYIHLLWMANTYIYVLYVHTCLCMPDNILSDLSNWFGTDYSQRRVEWIAVQMSHIQHKRTYKWNHLWRASVFRIPNDEMDLQLQLFPP